MNIYYNPEKFGLEPVAHADAGGGWDFDMFQVWRDKGGEFFWAEDSGCSCPSPFEDMGLEDLRMGSARDALNDLKYWVENGWNDRRAGEARQAITVLEGLVQ